MAASTGGDGGDADADEDEEYLVVVDEAGEFAESKEDDYEKPASARREGFSVSDPSVEAASKPAPPVPPKAGAATAAAEGALPPPVVPPRAPTHGFSGDDLELKRAVRKLLRAEGIRLWEPPYSLEDGRSSMPSDLADRYASSLVIAPARVFDALETLRISSRKKQNLSIPPSGEASRTYTDAITEG